MQSPDGNTHPKYVMERLVSFVLMATLLLVVILDSRMTSPEKQTGPNQIDRRLMELPSSPADF